MFVLFGHNIVPPIQQLKRGGDDPSTEVSPQKRQKLSSEPEGSSIAQVEKAGVNRSNSSRPATSLVPTSTEVSNNPKDCTEHNFQEFTSHFICKKCCFLVQKPPAPTPTSLPPLEKKKWKVGEEIEAVWTGDNEFYEGEIKRAYDDDTYDILFEDNDFDSRTPYDKIRERGNMTAETESSEESSEESSNEKQTTETTNNQTRKSTRQIKQTPKIKQLQKTSKRPRRRTTRVSNVSDPPTPTIKQKVRKPAGKKTTPIPPATPTPTTTPTPTPIRMEPQFPEAKAETTPVVLSKITVSPHALPLGPSPVLLHGAVPTPQYPLRPMNYNIQTYRGIPGQTGANLYSQFFQAFQQQFVQQQQQLVQQQQQNQQQQTKINEQQKTNELQKVSNEIQQKPDELPKLNETKEKETP